MPTSRRVPLLALVAIVAVSAAYAQKPSARPQEVFAPYWTSEPGWDTELELKNNLASAPLTVTPVLRLASGEEIPLDPVTIPSNVSVSVWVNEGLLKYSPGLLNQPGSYGSVVFRFTSLNAMNLYATVAPSIQGEPIAFPVRVRPAPPKGEAWVHSSRPGSLEGIWWQPRSGLKDVLAISNSSQGKINGTLSLFDAGGKHWSEPLSFAPYQTQRMSISDLLLKAGLSGSYGGIELNVPAAARALAGVHFMYDEASAFSASLEMFSRDPNATIRERTGSDAAQWTLRAPTLALSAPDPALGLPAEIALQPTILVRNTTSNKIWANIILSWMTLNPGTNNYDGHYVEESSPSAGTNSCWWKGSGMVQYPTVIGSTWTVGQSPAPHDGYGLDGIGFSSGVVNLIQTQGAANGVSFPCVVTIYQEMTYEGDADTFYVYAENVLTQTITSNTVNVGRAGVCSGTIPF